MKTDELIASLAADATPVRPLSPPAVRLGRWLVMAALLSAAVVAAFGLRPDLATAVVDPRFLAIGLLAAATTVAAAAAALILAVPGAERSGLVRWLPVGLLTLWCATMVLLIAGQGFVMAGSVEWPTGLCGLKVVGIGLAPALLLFVMVRRSAPIRAGWAAGLAGVAGLSCGSLGVEFVCPNWHAGHLFVTHHLPVVVLAAMMPLTSSLLLAWTRRVPGHSA